MAKKLAKKEVTKQDVIDKWLTLFEVLVEQSYRTSTNSLSMYRSLMEKIEECKTLSKKQLNGKETNNRDSS